MIVQARQDHLLLITQPDHAALAGQVMAAWCRDSLPDSARRDTVLHAISEHDNGWDEIDRAPVVDESSGRILDFVTAPEALRQSVWPRGIARLAATPYAAALVAQHALVIYDQHRGEAAWREFFAGLEAARDTHLRAAAPLTARDLDRDYFFVRMGDLLSLMFCAGWTEAKGYGSYEVGWDGARLTVSPDPFAGREVPLAVTARRLPDRRFTSATDAAAEYGAAPPLTLTAVAAGR